MGERVRGYLAVLLGASSYGLVAVIVKLAFDDGLGSASIATSQSMLGVVVLLVALAVRRLTGHSAPPATSRDRVGLLGLGVSTGVTAVLYYGALERLSASLAVVLLFQFTWMGVLLEAALTRQRPSAASLASVVLAWAGTVLASGLAESSYARAHVLSDPVGLLYGFGAGAAYTVFVVGTSRVGTRVAPIERSAFMAASALGILCVAFPPRFLGDPALVRALLPWSSLLACFGVIVPNVTFAYGSPRIGGERASIVAAVELPVAVLAAAIVLGERTSMLALFGVLLILAAVALPALVRSRTGDG